MHRINAKCTHAKPQLTFNFKDNSDQCKITRKKKKSNETQQNRGCLVCFWIKKKRQADRLVIFPRKTFGAREVLNDA